MSTHQLGVAPTPPEALSLGDVLAADKAAALLGVSRWTIYSAANRHEVPHRRLGRPETAVFTARSSRCRSHWWRSTIAPNSTNRGTPGAQQRAATDLTQRLAKGYKLHEKKARK